MSAQALVPCRTLSSMSSARREESSQSFVASMKSLWVGLKIVSQSICCPLRTG